MENNNNVLEIRGLNSYFFTEKGVAPAVDGLDLDIPKGKIIGLVGESGCGKSMTAKSIMGLLKYPGRVAGGSIRFEDQDLTRLSDKELRKICGNDISMIFQEPMTSLNPVYTVGYQISEMILRHEKISKKEARARAIEMLRLVNIPAPEKRIDEYPHELSGGMRQRVMIAMALSCNPELLIADEPTTALDVTIQAQILDLMRTLKQTLNTSIMMITHDLGVVAEMSDYVLVMYAGMVMEYSDVRSLFADPLHPYTQGLQAAIPRLDEEKDTLLSIPGNVPMLYDLPKGCIFSPRCAHATEQCRNERPELVENSGHLVRCFLYEDNKKHTESQSKGGAQA